MRIGNIKIEEDAKGDDSLVALFNSRKTYVRAHVHK
jgi:hypothetical protein